MVMTDERTNGNRQHVWVPGLAPFDEGLAPSYGEIQSLINQAKTYFDGFRRNCQKVDQYYYGLNPVPSPAGFEAIHTNQARATINVATDHVDVNNVSIIVPPASARAKARAERLQKFYQGTWVNIKGPVKRTATRHAFAYGIGWFKTLWNADRWPGAPRMDDFKEVGAYREALTDWMEQRNIHFPIVVKNVNPQRLYWDVSEIGPRWAIEDYRMRLQDIRAMYPQWTGTPESDGLFRWTEYWDDKWYVYIANNEIVESGEHGYGFMPYVPVEPASSMDWDDRPPHERYQGLLDGNYDLLDEGARSITAYSAILRSVGWTTMDFQAQTVGAEQNAEDTRQNYELFGGKNLIRAGVEVKPSPHAIVPPELLQHLNVISNFYEEATFPNVVRGVRPRGVSSGFGVSVLAGMGRLVFQGVADGMARAIEQCNSNFAKIVEFKALGAVTVHARSEIHSFDQTIGPDDVRGYYENIVSLKAEAPEEREREALLARNLLQAGIISLYEAQKRAGVTNPLEMQIDQQAERLLLDPTVQMAMAQLVAERVGLLNQLAQTVDASPPDTGNAGQFQPGLSQLQRPGEAGIQRQRQDTLQQGAFPRGQGGIDILGALLGSATGGAARMPSGQTVR